MVVGMGGGTDVRAQVTIPAVRGPAPAAQAQAGIHLLRTDRPEQALPYLRRAVRADSTLQLADHGAAAYWLGAVYARLRDTTAASRTWRRGMRALDEAGGFDLRLADAYLRSLTPAGLRAERLRAVRVYTRLLGAVGADTTTAGTQILRRRVAQIAPMLSDTLFKTVVAGAREADPSTWTFRAEGGDALRTWWRGLDPYPATPENERLEEHLTRLVRAQRGFRCPEPAHRLDDRGMAHLRYGAPWKRHVLDYKDMGFFQEVFRFGVPTTPSGFPEAELWVYPQIDTAAYFLFVEDQGSGCYDISPTEELMPAPLRYGRGGSDRGLNIAYSSLMALRAIYEELSLYHIDYSGRYTEIANYANWQEMMATAARAGMAPGGVQQTRVGAGAGMTRIVSSDPLFGQEEPSQFIQQIMARAQREDRNAAQRRDEAMPRRYSALQEDTPRLAAQMRAARFLNADGTTRTEVYWGVPTDEVRLRDDENGRLLPSMIRLSALQADAAQRLERRLTRRYRIDSARASGQSFVAPSLTFDSSSSARFHLRLQWTQYRLWDTPDSTQFGLGPKHRVAFTRVDSLKALRTAGPLEMSDVEVMRLSDTTGAARARPRKHATPYPFRRLTADTPLLLAFELYHLTRGADDRTRYTLAYDVRGRTQRGWTRLVRGQDTQRTRTETTVEGTRRRTNETILLDLSELVRDEAQTVQVTVRVTDEVADTTQARTVEFELAGTDN
jgi:GWxTD domain-containing protein